ncbi:ParB N-terminal domain-containing protein [Priestia megaterium]|uniref:ParB N-terminal domain-containing protein n=1 Tax=Priestia megaterium TaxID=1404 RepID=UPI0033950C0C
MYNYSAESLNLKMVPTEMLLEHEYVDEEKIKRICRTLRKTKIINDPIQCIKMDKGYLVIDGHHRLNALKKLGIRSAPIQVLEKNQIKLDYWFHSFDIQEISFSKAKDGIYIGELVINNQSTPLFVNDKNEISDYANKLFSCYKKSYKAVYSKPQDGSWIRFDGLSFEDIEEQAANFKIMPPTITRFIIKFRVLNLNVPITVLGGNNQNDWLDFIKRKEHARVYDQPVVNFN